MNCTLRSKKNEFGNCIACMAEIKSLPLLNSFGKLTSPGQFIQLRYITRQPAFFEKHE
jgi:hypothetical protein